MTELEKATLPIYKFPKDKKIALIECFAGIGAQAAAFKRLGLDFVHHRVYEISKYACASYSAIHGVDVQPTDICTVKGEDLGITDKEHYTYFLTYSFPCQSISLAGLQHGYAEGSGTRSSLLWEIKRILNECGDNLPDVLLMENVPAVRNKKNIEVWNAWIEFLESKGYSNFAENLNAKDYGIPQNRNRCFCVSILGKYRYEFPEPKPLMMCMADLLEDEVDECYYINTPHAKELIAKLVEEGKLEKLISNPIRVGGGGTMSKKHNWDAVLEEDK